MKVGVRIPNAGPLAGPEALTRAARRAEELGFDSVWTTEHFALPEDYEPTYSYTATGKSWWDADSPHLEPLTALTWVAARTERILLGTSVIVLPYRHPVVLAKLVASVDQLSGGRLILGCGLGWLEPEFAALGIPIKQRVSRMNECLQALRALLGEERPVHEGKRYRFDGSWGFAPKPVQRPWPPIWIGGEARGALERVARWGDGWHPGGMTPEELRPKLAELHEVCEEVGRDPGEIDLSLRVLPARPLDDESLQELAELGVGHVILDPAYIHGSVEEYLEDLRDLSRYVEIAHGLDGDGR